MQNLYNYSQNNHMVPAKEGAATMPGFACPQGWAFLHKENQGKKGQIPGGTQSQAWWL
jgi:hypothetical protein